MTFTYYSKMCTQDKHASCYSGKLWCNCYCHRNFLDFRGRVTLKSISVDLGYDAAFDALVESDSNGQQPAIYS